MKKVRFLLLAAMVAMFTSCQKEVAEQELDNNKPTPTGDTRIIIEGEGMIDPVTRSSDGRVDFEGGYATGAGLYDGDARPIVAAYPDAGYEVNYFYGGPENELHRYDYAQSRTSTFDVKLRGEDHTFRCGFKEKKRNLTVNAGTGGSVSPAGTNSYRVEKPINITANPNNGYKFTGWTVTEGDVTIENPGSQATAAILHNNNSTITANFVKQHSSNYIWGYLSGWRHAGAIFTFKSTYTTTKDLYVNIESQGDYEMEVDGRFEVYPYYDDLGGQTLRLVAGQKEWKVEYLPGIDTGARITSIQWQIKANEDSDDNYKYIIEANVGREEN
ncbi:hypothetical protein ACIXUG_21995 [Bacteroides fragilis]